MSWLGRIDDHQRRARDGLAHPCRNGLGQDAERAVEPEVAHERLEECRRTSGGDDDALAPKPAARGLDVDGLGSELHLADWRSLEEDRAARLSRGGESQCGP